MREGVEAPTLPLAKARIASRASPFRRSAPTLLTLRAFARGSSGAFSDEDGARNAHEEACGVELACMNWHVASGDGRGVLLLRKSAEEVHFLSAAKAPEHSLRWAMTESVRSIRISTLRAWRWRPRQPCSETGRSYKVRAP